MSPLMTDPSSMTLRVPPNSCRAMAAFSSFIPLMVGDMEAIMLSNRSGSFDISMIAFSSSSVIWISSYSCCSNSMDTTSTNTSKTVVFTLSVFSAERIIPFIVTLFPGVIIPATSSSMYPLSLWGCAPPLRPSGLSCISTFWVSV